MTATGVARDGITGEVPAEFSPSAYLLHALNQPLTGLQCSLELAMVGERTAEQYLQVIGAALELLGRMRALAAALREVTDIARQPLPMATAISLDELVRQTVDELRPVAEARAILIDIGRNALPRSCLVRGGIGSTLFQFLESVLSLAAAGSILGLRFSAQSWQAGITVLWNEELAASGQSSFSYAELGLIVARAAWQHAGGSWTTEISGGSRTVTIGLPWADGDCSLQPPKVGDNAGNKPGDELGNKPGDKR
ncbi:MAG TPA: hypothetical protein VI386_18310 [Candidatus Sulfotelmatobacter sp.]